LFGQVGAGAHARRQQPAAEDRQDGDFEQRQHPPDLLQGVAGAARPQGQLRCPLRGLSDVVDAAEAGVDRVQKLPAPGGGDVGPSAL
jgi:hypothetical protein